MLVRCASEIESVVVYARGALVTRSAPLPRGLDRGPIDLVLGGVTPLAEGGSLRARLRSSRRSVLFVRSEIVYPTAHRPAANEAELREIERRIEVHTQAQRALAERRQVLLATMPAPELRTHDGRARKRDNLQERVADALEIADELSTLVRGVDEALERHARALETLQREHDAALLQEDQSTDERPIEDRLSTQVIVRLGPLAGDDAPELEDDARMELTYAVPAARWWPVYTLRLSNGGATGAWGFDAMVAQRSCEDWSAARMSFSSGDLHTRAQLPELSSLRLSRSQERKRPVYRAPPPGIDLMFSAYLELHVQAFRSSGPAPAAAPTDPMRGKAVHLEDAVTRIYQGAGEFDEHEADTGVMREVSAPSFEGLAPLIGAPPTTGAPRDRRLPPSPAAMPMPSMSQAFAAPPGAAMPQAKSRGGSPLQAFGAAFGSAGGGGPPMLDEGAVAFVGPPAPPEPEVVPQERWLAHDALLLCDADDPVSRGRLVNREDTEVSALAVKLTHELQRAWPSTLKDPKSTRGMFDVRYEAQGTGDVPSDGRLHRVRVGEESCTAKLLLSTTPLVDPRVYREAELKNPFALPLLGGSVDVYLDGSLLTTTSVDRVPRGGVLAIGMGVDDRFKVARNVRTTEESQGLLGGGLAVTHIVEIDVASTVGEVQSVQVFERVPVTDDKALEVKVLRAEPPPEDYDQRARSAPLRGGKRFVLSVPKGGKARAELAYRLAFSNKLDIVGGSRRG